MSYNNKTGFLLAIALGYFCVIAVNSNETRQVVHTAPAETGQHVVHPYPKVYEKQTGMRPQNRFSLRCHVTHQHNASRSSTYKTGAYGELSRAEQRFMPIQSRYGTMLRSFYGDTTTTLIPADWLPATGVNGPFDGGVSYTPQYKEEIAAYLSHYQLTGPMSVVHTGAGELRPSVLTSQDILVNGIPQRVSGSMIMERPGYEDWTIAQSKPRYVSAKQRYVSSRTTGYHSRTNRVY